MALFINKEKLGVDTDFKADYTAYSGTDIIAALYMPSLTKKTVENVPSKKFKVFANLQTLSVSSTRSISPVRVLGNSSPIAYTRGGRCIPATEKVLVRDKGYISIANVEVGDFVQSSSTTYDEVTGITRDGIKTCYKLVTDNGYNLIASYDHPVYTGRGWVRMEELTLQDIVYVVGSSPSPEKDMDIPDDIIIMLGYLIGDGMMSRYKKGTGHEHRINLTISKKEITSIGLEVALILDKLGIPYRDEDLGDDTGCIERRISVCLTGHATTDWRLRKYNTLHEWLTCLDLYQDSDGTCGKKSHNKFIPQEFISSLTKRQIALFLNRLYSTDGHYSVSGHNSKYIEAGYCSTSLKLIEAVRILLNKLGIQAIYRCNKKIGKIGGRPNIISRHDTHTLTISNSKDLLKFITTVGIKGKQNRIEPCVDLLKDRMNSHRLSNHKEFTSLVKDFCKENNINYRKITIKFGLYNYKVGITIRKARAIIKTLTSSSLKDYVDTEIDNMINETQQWVKIPVKHLSNVGKLPIYDLEVKDRHEFICNFIKVHNTIAGTMVFAALTRDAFTDVYDESITESYTNSLKLFTPDQLPPFSIIITMTAEKGGTAYQIINGITLVNYGTTYSIDDLYTEVVYTYVATECTPLISTQEARISDIYSRIHYTQQAGLTPSIDEYLYKLYANSFPGASRDKLTELININIANEINDRNS